MELSGKKNVLILDLETTGLSSDEDEIIEFGCILCLYDCDNQELSVQTVYSSLRQPLNKKIEEIIKKYQLGIIDSARSLLNQIK